MTYFLCLLSLMVGVSAGYLLFRAGCRRCEPTDAEVEAWLENVEKGRRK